MIKKQQFLPGDPAPQTGQYQEHEPHTWKCVRRLLIPSGDAFPRAQSAGGFFTFVDPARKFAAIEPGCSSD